MGKLRHYAVTLLLVCGLGPSLHASDADIIWGVNSAPPFHVVEGYFAKQGVCDAMVEAFQRALPDTDQRISRYPAGRIAALIRQGGDICYPCVIRLEQDTDVAYFSDTILEYPAHGIITRPELAQTFTERFGNPVDFVELLKTGDYRFGQPLGRRYGTLQPYIERFLHNTSRFSEISGADANANMLAMVNASRIDFVVDYPMLLNYHNQILPIELVFLPIKENYGEIVEGAVGCPATPWGKRAIELINSAIPEVIQDPKFVRAKDRWLLPQNP
ncbi:hypothetical protein [Pseudidiomarina terrestris]|uniref:hypothetical protein n=1 Tax=Pseudidiomarina terrestris TaxID=2820060 RepID=UPI00264F12E6|nr:MULTISPECIES: hypothetical protein [unclassified Pseudidiomarina]MDN7136326.1 hypothetical protein [Pseudidiomarina sp. 1ASP75-5]MDN7138757.1 hypothetical protein [Pseudidiomarina sp. 1ASP75-14]